jgi:hypothetical protein
MKAHAAGLVPKSKAPAVFGAAFSIPSEAEACPKHQEAKAAHQG